MLVAIGTKVVLIHSNDEAVVTELLDDGMVQVRLLDSNLEIPVFAEDIKRLDKPVQKPVKAKVVPGKKPKQVRKPKREPAETQYTIIKSFGIQLAFSPIIQADETTEKYEIFLINDTPHPVLFGFQLDLDGRKVIRKDGKLDATSTINLGDLFFDELNDAPVCHLECWRILTDGTGPRMAKKLKIKPKTFFKKLKTAPLLNRPVHLYRIFEKLETRTGKRREEDLQTYTRRNIQPTNWFEIGQRMPHEVIELAEFVPEIDLHIDRLAPKMKKKDKAAILRIQLEHFEKYMDQAIRLGVERVFIIHGIGEGRLKNHIASRLIQMPEVKSFKNEYHPRYGYGATEVVF